MASPEPASAVRRPVEPATVPIPGGNAVAPFRLAATPVTNRQYAPFLEAGKAPPPPWWTDAAFCAAGQPVVGVAWTDAAAFCVWLSEVAGGTWRLPTEAEWEHAACGGLVAPPTAWGERVPPGEIPDGPLSGPWEAGRGAPNGYGLFDMGTIVHEWCANPHGPDPRRRASRGGSWRHRVRWSSPSATSSLLPDFRYSDYGFRPLREIDV
jgi:formylglycine-generating enzyme required for sulfatase activity